MVILKISPLKLFLRGNGDIEDISDQAFSKRHRGTEMEERRQFGGEPFWTRFAVEIPIALYVVKPLQSRSPSPSVGFFKIFLNREHFSNPLVESDLKCVK